MCKSPSTGDQNDFWVDAAPVRSQQVDLINDQQSNLLHIGPVLPVAADTVPLLGRADDDVSSQQGAHVRRVITCEVQEAMLSKARRQLTRVEFKATVTTIL